MPRRPPEENIPFEPTVDEEPTNQPLSFHSRCLRWVKRKVGKAEKEIGKHDKKQSSWIGIAKTIIIVVGVIYLGICYAIRKEYQKKLKAAIPNTYHPKFKDGLNGTGSPLSNESFFILQGRYNFSDCLLGCFDYCAEPAVFSWPIANGSFQFLSRASLFSSSQ